EELEKERDPHFTVAALTLIVTEGGVGIDVNPIGERGLCTIDRCLEASPKARKGIDNGLGEAGSRSYRPGEDRKNPLIEFRHFAVAGREQVVHREPPSGAVGLLAAGLSSG